jgi:hypothetical protein
MRHKSALVFSRGRFLPPVEGGSGFLRNAGDFYPTTLRHVRSVHTDRTEKL